MPVQETLLLDDTVGALTRSVYEATAGTEAAFTKMISRLNTLNDESAKFTSALNQHSSSLASEAKLAKMSTSDALQASKRITSGIADTASAKVLQRLIDYINKSSTHIVSAIKSKNFLKDTISEEGRVIRDSGSRISGATQKGFAVVSVATRICDNAKTMQSLAKNVVDRAERVHLSNAAPQLHNALDTIKKLIQIEQKILPIKLDPINKIVPQKIDQLLEQTYQSNVRAVDLANRSLNLSGSARSREVVDLRDELRNALDAEQDILDLGKSVTNEAITHKIVPESTTRTTVINQDLIPTINSFKVMNKAVLKEIDRNRSMQIDSGITKKVLRQSGVGGVGVAINWEDERFKSWSDFL
jgi:hypothetical protein